MAKKTTKKKTTKKKAKAPKKITKRVTKPSKRAAGAKPSSTKKKKTTKASATKKTTKKTTKKKATTKASPKPAAASAKQTKKKTTKKTTKKKAAPPVAAAPRPAKKPAATRPIKRLRAVYQPPAPEPLTPAQLRKVKTGLTKRDLMKFRQQLLQKRAQILGDVESLEIDARTKNAGGNLSNMPVHMADVGSDNYEQEFTLGLVESERRLVLEINEALGRIDQKIYGVCLESGVPIGRARLEAKPWAKYCIEVARERERRGLR